MYQENNDTEKDNELVRRLGQDFEKHLNVRVTVSVAVAGFEIPLSPQDQTDRTDPPQHMLLFEPVSSVTSR